MSMIELMYMDKHGACNAFGTFDYVISAGLKINLTVGLAWAENCVSDRAYKPSEIIRSLSGQTVYVGNTDAEGRMVMCDTLTYL